jgi:hypothetical protein
MGLTQTATTIEAVGFLTVGHYGFNMRPGQFATMPPDRADYFVGAGLARVVTKTPPDVHIASYTEHDFRLPAEPAHPEKLTRDDICARFAWSPEQFESAVAFCGFPPASMSSYVTIQTGGARVIQRWREDIVMQWRDRVSSLCLG